MASGGSARSWAQSFGIPQVQFFRATIDPTGNDIAGYNLILYSLQDAEGIGKLRHSDFASSKTCVRTRSERLDSWI